MPWGVRFRIREYLKGSLWFYPLIGAILGPFVAVIVHQADAHVTLPAAWQYSPSTASTLLTTIVGATVGLTGFVVTVSVPVNHVSRGPHSCSSSSGHVTKKSWQDTPGATVADRMPRC